ncbi:MAG: FtsX-like permease family protein [Bacteroidota bacterium]
MKHHSPPRWPLRCLRYFLRAEYLEELEGDLEEIYQELSEEYSLTKANRSYTWEVLRMLRLSLIKPIGPLKLIHRPIMLKNNLTVAWRVFRREKVYTAVNLLGTALSLAVALLIMRYVNYERSYEAFNPAADQVVRITMDILDGGVLVDQDCETYPPLGPLIKDQMPEVEEFVRTYNLEGLVVKVGNEAFSQPEGVYAADPSFFRVMNYPLLYGSLDGLFEEPFEVVLTESLALRYFGRTDVVGERLESAGDSVSLLVKGVIRDSPPNTHLKVKFLLSYVTMEAALGESPDNWDGNNTFTYLKLTSPAAYGAFEAKLEALNEKLNQEEKLASERVIAQPMRDIHLYSDKSFEAEINGDATSVYFLFGVAILVLIIAMVNYINLSTSKALDRAKEVGVRKILGSSLGQLRAQFFTEAALLNSVAGVLALVLVSLTWPAFKTLAQLPADLSLANQAQFWLIWLSLILSSTLVAGMFPAFILSSFKPISVLKGKYGQSSRGIWLRKGLVVLQFVITLFLLIQTLTADLQLRFLQQIDLGVDIEQTLVVRTPDRESMKAHYASFRHEILQQSYAKAVTRSSCVPGLPSHEMGTTTGIDLVETLEPHNYNFYIYFMDEEFIPTMSLEVLAGQNFLPASENQPEVLNELEVIVNEESIRLWGIPSPEEALGKELDMWGKKRRIRAVIKNFHQAGAKSDFIPIIFMQTKSGGDFISIKLQPGDTRSQVEQAEAIYHATFPNSAFDYFFMDQEYNKQYQADVQFGQVFSLLTGFAILIACVGLFGLVSFTVLKRGREIGIRKVLGASVTQILNLLGREFILLLVASTVMGLPLSYYLIHRWLERYAFRIDLPTWVFWVPVLIILLVAGLTVYSQTVKVAIANPAQALRDE